MKGRNAKAAKGIEPRKGSRPAGDVDQVIQGGSDMDEKAGFPLFTTEKTIRPQGLHQTLGGGQIEELLEFTPTLQRSGKVVIDSQECIAIGIS